MNSFKKFSCVNLRVNSKSTSEASSEVVDFLSRLNSSKMGFDAISVVLVNTKPIEYQIFYSYLENLAFDDESTEEE